MFKKSETTAQNFRSYPSDCPGFEGRVVPDAYEGLSDEDLVRLCAVETFPEMYEILSKVGVNNEADFMRVLEEDMDRHGESRLCLQGCGCTEFYDSRNGRVTGSFGVAGCVCKSC